MDRGEKLQLMYNLLLIIVIGVMITTTLILVRNKNIIVSDPLAFGMVVHNFTSCGCVDAAGKTWTSKDGGFINYENLDGETTYNQKINWGAINLSR